MKLSTRARYALRMMLDMSRHQEDGLPVSLKEISERTRISNKYLEQLVIALKNRGLIRAVSGRGGGYFLAREPQKIKIGEIVEASIGQISIVECVGDPDLCMLSDSCECRLIWSLINKRIRNVLAEFSLADLSDRKLLAGVRKQLADDEPAGGTIRPGRRA
ncbi:MAG: Rrf2 family transcriptional regulator [Acidobacteriota bacterium]